jgi:hypothetical protein
MNAQAQACAFLISTKIKEAGPTGLSRLFFGFFTVKSFFGSYQS